METVDYVFSTELTKRNTVLNAAVVLLRETILERTFPYVVKKHQPGIGRRRRIVGIKFRNIRAR